MMLDAFAASGLSGAKFAELHGVKYQTFAGWLARRRRSSGARALPVPGNLALVEVEAPADRGGASLALRLPGGAEVHVTGVAGVPLAAALIRELARPC